jgi:hypothetical protein
MIGIMLLNSDLPLGKNIKDNGWAITADPNSNTAPYNYNQFTDSRNQKVNWTISAPGTTGTYYIKAHARHGLSQSKDRNLTSAAVMMEVQAIPEFPYGQTIAISLSAIIYFSMKKKALI